MTTLEEIRTMHAQGMNEDQIIQIMREKGLPYKEIAEGIAQTKIKAAVENSSPEPSFPQENVPAPTEYTQGMVGMEPSMMSSIMNSQTQQQASPAYSQQEVEASTPEAPYPGQTVQQQQSGTYGYDQYAPVAGNIGVSTDLITEISEQIMAEKLSEIRKSLEKVIDLRTTVESRIEMLDDRLKRIEKVLDTLQSSVLRKVGDYITNVQDIKNELIETQKTFSKLVPNTREHKKPDNLQAHQHKQ